jgi:glutamate-1-semialdehyde aminotransferase
VYLQQKLLINGVRLPATVHYNFPYTRDKQSELAALLVGASPAVEQVVFFNSGSDATAMALRAARAHTGKDKLGIFDGAYHGTHDWAQVAAASGTGHSDHPVVQKRLS